MMTAIRKKKHSKIGNEPIGYFFIAPFYLFFFFMVLIPIFTGIMQSFTNYDLYQTNDFVGLANYNNC